MRGLRRILAASTFVVAMIKLATTPALAVFCQQPGPFEEGQIKGGWVGVFLNLDGRPGGPHDATVYTMTMTAGGRQLINLGEVRARGEGAAELRALFVDNYLYIVNNRYAPGSTNQQYEYYEIQRFGIQSDRLILEAEGSLNLSRLPVLDASPYDCNPFPFDKPLRNVIESGNLDKLWTPVAQSAAP